MFMAALLIIIKNQKQPKCPSVSKWTNRPLGPYKGTLLSHTKQQATDTHNLSASHMHSAEWRKPGSTGYILYDSICVAASKRMKLYDREEISGCQRLVVEKRFNYERIAEGFFGVIELFYTLTVVVFTQI